MATGQQRIDAAYARAIPLPGITQGEAFTLTLFLGMRAIGFDMVGDRNDRAGPALSLVGATVKLTARRVPETSPYYTREIVLPGGSTFPYSGHGYGGYGYLAAALFAIDGTVTDAAGGVVTFAITGAQTALGLGMYLIEPRVTLPAGVIVPGALSLTIAERL